MLRLLPLAALALPASAFPFLTPTSNTPRIAARTSPETNCGPIPCNTFDANEQYVDISAATGHQYVAPTAADRRGPCPGLNAAANHGYIPHSGILTIGQTVTGLAAAYGMGADLAAGLAVVEVVLGGDPVGETWSIGGPYKALLIGGALGGEEPQGISYSHNNYEGDGSVTRQDAYLNNGDAFTLQVDRFEALYNLAETYTLDILRGAYAQNQETSIATNPYYFNAQFSGLLVVPAAHNFIINFFSNHSAAQPNGYLDRHTLKTFFAITGEPGSFVYSPGQEKIPANWYRRPSSDQYLLANALADVSTGYSTNPSTFKFGGNTGTVNSFAGIDVGNLTGGTYSAQDLLQGNNLGCFVIQAQQQNFPDVLKGLVGDISPALDLADKYLGPILDELDCPVLAQYNQGLFNDYPGYKYDPQGSR